MNTDKDVRQVEVSEVDKQPRVLSTEEVLQKLKEISEAAPEDRDALWGNLMTTDEEEPEDVSVSEDLFLKRAREMMDELEKMVEEEEESRAMILVAVEGRDEGRDFPLLHVSSKGSKEMLVEAFKSIYIDERLKRALDEVLYRELKEITRRNIYEGKRIEARRVLLVHGPGAPRNGAIPIPRGGRLVRVRLGRGSVGQPDGRSGGTIYPREGVGLCYACFGARSE